MEEKIFFYLQNHFSRTNSELNTYGGVQVGYSTLKIIIFLYNISIVEGKL